MEKGNINKRKCGKLEIFKNGKIKNGIIQNTKFKMLVIWRDELWKDKKEYK